MRTKKSHSEPSPTRLQLLIDEYKSARDDERSEMAILVTVLGTVMASTITTLLALQTIVWISMLTPIAALALSAYSVSLIQKRAIRSFHIRALEREIRLELDDPTRFKKSASAIMRPRRQQRPIVFTLKELEHVSIATGDHRNTSFMAPLFTATCITTTVVALGRHAYYQILVTNDALAAGAALGYGFTFATILRALVYSTLYARTQYEHAVQLVQNRDDPFSRRTPLTTYNPGENGTNIHIGERALDPIFHSVRPDAMLKGTHELVGTLLCYTLIQHTRLGRIHDERLLLLIAMLLVFEVLAYQTRYLVKDILGRNEEAVLRSRGQRGRMTGSPGHVLSAVRSLMLRGALIFVSVILALFSGVGLTFTIGIALLALLTAVYEAVRRAEAKTAHSPGTQNILARLTFILVSLGIPLRFVFGFSVYSELYFGSLHEALQWMSSDGWAFVPLALWYFCFSLTTVAPTWALEGLYEAGSYDRGVLQFEWRAEGKRHVWISLGCFLRPLGIAPGDFPCPLSNSLGDRELSGHECWTAISNQSTPLLQRLRGWMVAPWVISATGGVVAAHLFLSSLYNAPTPPLVILVSALAHFLLSAVAMDCIATRGSGLLGMVLTIACALVPASLVLAVNADLVGSTWIWVIALVLFFYGGPLWFYLLQGRYSDTRSILKNTARMWGHLDIQIANKLLDRT